MKGAGPFIALFVIIALIIEFIWWILGAIALVVLFYIVRAAVRFERVAREAHKRHCAEIAARADQQHIWVLRGDDRGIYGEYPVSEIVKAPLPQPRKERQ
jgi:hypothetical protein